MRKFCCIVAGLNSKTETVSSGGWVTSKSLLGLAGAATGLLLNKPPPNISNNGENKQKYCSNKMLMQMSYYQTMNHKHYLMFYRLLISTINNCTLYNKIIIKKKYINKNIYNSYGGTCHLICDQLKVLNSLTRQLTNIYYTIHLTYFRFLKFQVLTVLTKYNSGNRFTDYLEFT